MSSTCNQPQATYEIQVQGELDADWRQWFNGLAITLRHHAEQMATTTLVGPVLDQAALRGLLCKLWDLNLTVISVRRLEPDGKEEQANG
jgi:hypothetical protein